jgi:uncharacterized protein (DUF983 family)
MKHISPFSCPNCGKKLPFIYTFNANESTRVRCNHCSTVSRLKLEKPLNMQFYIWIGFVPTALIARFAMEYYDSLVIGAFVTLIIMLPIIFIVCLYVYLTFEFTRD